MASANSTLATDGGMALASATNYADDNRTVLSRLPSGEMVHNSVFLHADLAGRPHRAGDFPVALREVIDLKEILGLGKFQMSHVWLFSCASASAMALVVSLGELLVKGRKYLIFDPDTREVHLKPSYHAT